MTDLTDLGVKAIRDGVAGGDFSAREVAEAFNANVAAAQDALNAFIVATPEKALEAADAVDAARSRGEPLGSSLEQLRDDVRGVIREVRDTLYDLRTDVSDSQDLPTVLETFIARVQDRFLIRDVISEH